MGQAWFDFWSDMFWGGEFNDIVIQKLARQLFRNSEAFNSVPQFN